MSKRSRPADPRQPDLFGPAGPSADAGAREPVGPRATPRGSARARKAPPGTTPAPASSPPVPALPSPGAAPPEVAPSEVGPPEAAPTPAGLAMAVPQTAPPPGPPPRELPSSSVGNRARPEFRSVDPLGLRAADRPDGYLYCVATREVAERLVREGMADEDPPALVERGAVPRHLAATAAELGWSDEQPGAIVVLRVRRGELAQAGAATPPVHRLRRMG